MDDRDHKKMLGFRVVGVAYLGIRESRDWDWLSCERSMMSSPGIERERVGCHGY